MGEEAIVFDDAPPPDDLTPQLTEPKQPEPIVPHETAEEKAPEVDNTPEPFSEKQQAKFNEEIARKVAKQREAERKAQALEEELAATKARVQQYEAPVRPDIPDPPDPYEPDFAQKVAYRDALIARAAQFDGQQAYMRHQEQQQAQERIQREQDRLRETVTTYSDTAEKLGISAQELAEAGKSVQAFGINDDLAGHILSDEMGPGITVYLAKNPLELDKLSAMSPLKAAAYIESHIKPNAKRPPPKLAPEPTESVKGSGAREGERGPKGTVYE